jgi:glycosyltransferase involved in cell wall biosynthesis
MTAGVLHILESMACGGMETTFLNFLRSFQSLEDKHALSHDVLSLAPGPLEPEFRMVAKDLFVEPAPAAIDGLLSRGYDVVHILFERCADRLGPILLGRFDGAVVYSKGYDLAATYRMEGGFDWTAEDSLLAACDYATFTTERLARQYDLPQGRVTVLEKACDYDKFSRVPSPAADTPLRILAVANLHPRKRIGDIAGALAHVRKRLPEAHARVVGAGSAIDVERVMREVEIAGAADAFQMAGSSRDVDEELALARVVVLPSEWEGVPTSLLEAMAAGRPVVATRVGHVESIVTHGKEGFLFDVGDTSSLAEYLVRLLSDPALCQRMGAEGKKRAAGHDVRVIAKRLHSVLSSAAASNIRRMP